jgi:hypothetical protein
MHNISCISHRAMRLCQAVCDNVYTVLLYQARFRESLCFPAFPEYLSASYFLACYCYQRFPALLIPFLMGIAMRTARTVITMSFGINAVKEYTAIAGILMEPPTKCHCKPPIVSTIRSPISANPIEIARFFVLFSVFGRIPQSQVMIGHAQIYPPVTPTMLLIPPEKLAKIGRPMAPNKT